MWVDLNGAKMKQKNIHCISTSSISGNLLLSWIWHSTVTSSLLTQEPYNSCPPVLAGVKSNRLPSSFLIDLWCRLCMWILQNWFKTSLHICRDNNVCLCPHPLTIVISVSMCFLFFYTEAEMVRLPSSLYPRWGKRWDGCRGRMPQTVVTRCLKATCCCCFCMLLHILQT